MKSLNKVTLVGYLGFDPKIVHTKDGTSIAYLNLSTHHTERPKNQDPFRKTLWHEVKVVGSKNVDFTKAQCIKGSHVLIEGMIDYYIVKDKHGFTYHKTEIQASLIMNLDR